MRSSKPHQYNLGLCGDDLSNLFSTAKLGVCQDLPGPVRLFMLAVASCGESVDLCFFLCSDTVIDRRNDKKWF